MRTKLAKFLISRSAVIPVYRYYGSGLLGDVLLHFYESIRAMCVWMQTESKMARLFIMCLLSVWPLERVLGSTRSVSDFAEIQAALADSTVNIVDVMTDITFTSQITISRAVTVRGGTCASGDAACRVTLDGGGSSRLFNIDSNGDAAFENLRLINVSAHLLSDVWP
jgi:hypothetical protein